VPLESFIAHHYFVGCRCSGLVSCGCVQP